MSMLSDELNEKLRNRHPPIALAFAAGAFAAGLDFVLNWRVLATELTWRPAIFTNHPHLLILYGALMLIGAAWFGVGVVRPTPLWLLAEVGGGITVAVFGFLGLMAVIEAVFYSGQGYLFGILASLLNIVVGWVMRILMTPHHRRR